MTLEAWAREIEGAPFEWGRTDCASLCVDGLKRAGILSPVSLSYSDAGGARRSWRTVGSLVNLLAWWGASEVSLSVARAGDIVVAPGGRFPSCSLVVWSCVLIGCREECVVALSTFGSTVGPVSTWRIPPEAGRGMPQLRLSASGRPLEPFHPYLTSPRRRGPPRPVAVDRG